MDVPIDTVGGVLIVRNGPEGLWTDEDVWSAEETLRIGAREGRPEELFGNAREMSVSVGPNGNVFILDAQSREVRVFAPDGTFVRKFGGDGDGPAELRSPLGMTWDFRGRLWVADFLHKYAVFDSTGALVTTLPRPARPSPSRQHRLHIDHRGVILDQLGGVSSLRYMRLDSLGTPIDTLPPFRLPDIPPAISAATSVPGRSMRPVLNYLPRLRWVVAPDRTVWTTNTVDYGLIQRMLEGDTVRVVETPHRRRRLGAVDRAVIAETLAGARVGDQEELFEYRPVVHGLNVMPDGHVLAHVVDSVGGHGHELDVFDPEGRFLGTMDLGFRMADRSIPAFRGDTLFAVAVDELDVPYVVRVTIHRTASGS